MGKKKAEVKAEPKAPAKPKIDIEALESRVSVLEAKQAKLIAKLQEQYGLEDA